MPRAPINGTELYYDEAGSGEPIIFHHGYTGSHDGWAEIVPVVGQRYRCIRMDARGAGDSAHPATGHTIEQFAADVVAMADFLGLDRFTYVGHSMGGVIGMELGMAYPERLNRLVLVAPAPADGIENSPAMMATRARSKALREAGDRETLIREGVALAPRSVREKVAKRIDRALSVSPAHYDEAWEALVTYRKGDRLSTITTPTLLMAGAADSLLAANLKDFQRLPNATLQVFSRVGHGVSYDQPESFAGVLLDFLEHGVITAASLQAALRGEPVAAH